jgi:oligopeptide/dipeptide ABC transporter ATP-binding protein
MSRYARAKIVEEADVEELLDNALHPYTQALIAAVPDPDPSGEKSKAIIKGEAPNPKYMPSGCRFHNRCPKIQEICTKVGSIFKEKENGRKVACHFA